MYMYVVTGISIVDYFWCETLVPRLNFKKSLECPGEGPAALTVKTRLEVGAFSLILSDIWGILLELMV